MSASRFRHASSATTPRAAFRSRFRRPTFPQAKAIPTPPGRQRRLIPGPSVLCCVERNDLISLPPDCREAYLRSYERFGDMALTEEKLPPLPLPLFRAVTPGRLPLIVLTNVKSGKGRKKK